MFKVYPINPDLERITKYSIEKKIAFLRSYFMKVEEAFQKETVELLNECRLGNERTKNDEDDSNYDYRASECLKEIEFVFTRMHRYSTILTVYSYFEASMEKFCNSIDYEKSGWKKKSNESVICSYKRFCEKSGKIDFSKINNTWESIDADLRQIRNCIAHANGDVKKCNKNIIEDVVSRCNGVSLIENDLLMLSSEFVDESIENVKIFLMYLVGYA